MSKKYLIIRGPAAGTVVEIEDLVLTDKVVSQNVRVLQGRYANKHVQVTDLVIPDEIKTSNGSLIKVANTTLIGTVRHMKKNGDLDKDDD